MTMDITLQKLLKQYLQQNWHSKSKIYIVFQPHRYSRTQLCFNEFVNALINADKVLLTIYSAGEKKISQINSNKIKMEVQKRNIKVDVVNFDSDLDLCKIKKQNRV